MTGPILSYPAGSITPQGAYYLLQGEIPSMKLLSHDGTAVFNLMGGENIADYYNAPENVYVKDLKGLVPPWKQIDQKGATQDGRSFITSLYDPAEVEATLVVKGKTPARVRKTRNDLIASIDAIRPSELSLFTHQVGRWWAPIRWLAEPRDPEGGTRTLRQVETLRWRAYDSFWRSYDVVDSFRLSHNEYPGNFSVDASSLPTADWDVSVTGSGTGGLTVSGGQVVPTMANGRTAIARRKGWSAGVFPPVIELTIGSLPQWFWDSSTALDFWMMKPTGTPGADGYRVRVTSRTVQLHHFVAGTPTLINTAPLQIPPKSGESWTFAGPVGFGDVYNGGFKLFRSGALAYSFQLPFATPVIFPPATYSAGGWGLYTSGTVAPPGIRAVSFGTDAPATQSGYVKMVNWGDQPMSPRFTCIGPGTFYLGDGPSSTQSVRFGPLGTNQIAQVVTDARKRGVVDLSVQPVTTAESNLLASGIQDFLGFANLVGGLIESITGLFGQASTPLPPQGTLYPLLSGRFSKASYIPPKPVGGPPKGYHVPVTIVGGTSDSQIIAAGTPLRRLPY